MNVEDVRVAKPASPVLTWLLLLLPLLLLGLILAYIVATGAGLGELKGPPVEKLAVERITLPAPGMIQVEVVNDGPQEITVAQVAVDDAFWSFTALPSPTIPRLGRATFQIPYPWVREELHNVKFITSIGMTFEGEIPAAVESPQPSTTLFMRFGLLGLYVGIVPILLGMLWYPLLRRSGRTVMNFVLCLTVGLLLYLAVSTWLDALEFAADLPVFWQGVPLVAFTALLTLGVLLATGRRKGGAPRTPLQIAYLIALGIGLHNLGEGLAIGAAFGLGEAALGTFLVLGFTLHNITEGVGIVSPLTRQRPPLWHFALLALLAGGPAILGVWVGGFVFNPVAATIFLGIGLGAIVQVIWEVGKLVVNDAARHQAPALTWTNLAGVALGVAVMYFTAFMVKF
jgi:zinc transporter, ZIP family